MARHRCVRDGHHALFDANHHLSAIEALQSPMCNGAQRVLYWNVVRGAQGIVGGEKDLFRGVQGGTFSPYPVLARNIAMVTVAPAASIAAMNAAEDCPVV